MKTATVVHGVCANCKIHKRIENKSKKNEKICANCYRKENLVVGICPNCKTKKNLGNRSKSGKRICCNCHRKENVAECSVCRNIDLVGKRDRKTDAVLCPKCYVRQRPRKVCAICKNIKSVHRRIGGNAICPNCTQIVNMNVCPICKNVKRLTIRTQFGAICRQCNTN